MQTDISEPKSRAFNLFLRVFHSSVTIIAFEFVSLFLQSSCSIKYFQTILILSVVSLLLSLAMLIILRFKQTFSKALFWIAFSIQTIILIVILGLLNDSGFWHSNCAQIRPIMWYIFAQIISLITIAVIVMVLPFFWSQRFTNSPGHLILGFLFFAFEWKDYNDQNLSNVGLMVLITGFFTFVSNLCTFCCGVTTNIRKCLLFSWIFGLILMLGGEALGITCLVHNGQHEGFIDTISRTLLEGFLIVNLIDFFFWLLGLLTLQQQNGDLIRDNIIHAGRNSNFQELQPRQQQRRIEQRGFGSLK